MEWRNVPGLPYQVSECGQVRRSVAGRGTRVGRVVKDHPHNKGYRNIVLSHEGKVTSHLVHVLVAAAFIGPCPEGKEVNHKNGVKHDNRRSNLEYVTHPKNVSLAFAIGLNGNRGEGHVNSKLTSIQVANIRTEIRENSMNCEILASKYGVAGSTIWRIVNGMTWKHILVLPAKS